MQRRRAACVPAAASSLGPRNWMSVPEREADEPVAVLRLALNVLWPYLRKPRRRRERRKPDGGKPKIKGDARQ